MGALSGYSRGMGWAEKTPARKCGLTIGCVVIVNTSDSHDTVGLFLDTRKPGEAGPPRWGANQFQNRRLRPQRAIMAYRTGDSTMCSVLVRVVMRHTATNEELDGVVGAMDLCDDGQKRNIAFPIKVTGPRISIESPGTAE